MGGGVNDFTLFLSYRQDKSEGLKLKNKRYPAERSKDFVKLSKLLGDIVKSPVTDF